MPNREIIILTSAGWAIKIEIREDIYFMYAMFRGEMMTILEREALDDRDLFARVMDHYFDLIAVVLCPTMVALNRLHIVALPPEVENQFRALREEFETFRLAISEALDAAVEVNLDRYMEALNGAGAEAFRDFEARRRQM